jgi:hypothetical protein
MEAAARQRSTREKTNMLIYLTDQAQSGLTFLELERHALRLDDCFEFRIQRIPIHDVDLDRQVAFHEGVLEFGNRLILDGALAF